MEKKKEEWQNNDSGYLNCIGVGDSYVKRQIERLLKDNYLEFKRASYWPCKDSFECGLVISTECPHFEPKENSRKEVEYVEEL